MKNVNTATIINQRGANNQAWFKQWFDTSFYHQLYANRDEKEGAEIERRKKKRKRACGTFQDA